MKKILSLCTFLASAFILMAQVSHGGHPLFRSNIQQVEFAPIVPSKHLQEDIDEMPGASPLRMGITRSVSLSSNQIFSSPLLDTVNGQVVATLRLASPGATFQSFCFSQFQLPEGAQMFFYDEQRHTVIGAFTKASIQPNGTFFTQAIPGEVCYMEYRYPIDSSAGTFQLAYVVQGYKDMYGDNFGAKAHIGYAQGDCHIDVACPDGDDWRDQIRSVVEIYTVTTNGGYLCSGALINNTANDKTPYVLSAYHCQELPSPLVGQVFYFNYQASACGADDAPINQTVAGCEYMALDGQSDFWLVRLNEQVPDAYQPYYAGWSREVIDRPALGCGIHHPGGDIKKISFPYRVQLSPTHRRFYRVDWISTRGVVEQGSSGSPLFNGNKLIIGQLWAAFGSVSCEDESGYSMYGRIASSWIGNGDPGSCLAPWLDPLYTDAMTCSGLDYTATAPNPDGVSGQGDYSDKGLFLYPNPSNGIVKLSLPTLGDASYTVRDLHGNTILQGSTIVSTVTHAINLSSLPSGAYVLELILDDQVYRNTFIIRK